MNAAAWAADLAELLLPAGCVCCGTWIPRRERPALVCARCRSRLRVSPWPRCERCHYPRGTGRPEDGECGACRDWDPALTQARHAFTLDPPADDVVHALKYEGWPELAPWMAGDMAKLDIPSSPARLGPVVVPVPTTAERMRVRGYNQAVLLAEHFARLRSLTLDHVLRRVHSGPSQTSLHPSERRANVAGAFAVVEEAIAGWRGAHVLLVDDVLTTGATASVAAAALVEAGAGAVTLVTYARALSGGRRRSS